MKLSVVSIVSILSFTTIDRRSSQDNQRLLGFGVVIVEFEKFINTGRTRGIEVLHIVPRDW